MSSLGERLRKSREGRDLSLDAVGRACGVSPQAVYGWESGKYKPSAAALGTIAELTGVNLKWLITGHGEARTVDGLTDARHIVGRVVPSVAFAALNRGRGSGSLDEPAQTYARSHFPCGPRSFQTVVPDRANEPTLLAGDSIIVDPDVAPSPGDFVIVATSDDEVLLRRYRPREKRVELAPVNGDWPTTTIKSLAAARLIGTVTEHCRKLR